MCAMTVVALLMHSAAAVRSWPAASRRRFGSSAIQRLTAMEFSESTTAPPPQSLVTAGDRGVTCLVQGALKTTAM